MGTAHDVVAELMLEWYPGWVLVRQPISAAEIIHPDTHIIVLPEVVPDLMLAVAHCLAHLDLHMADAAGRPFTREECGQADWLARLRLDRHDGWAA